MLPWILISTLAAALGGGAILWMVRRRSERSSGPPSVVMLRRQPRALSPSEVRAAYRRAYSCEPQVKEVAHPDGMMRAIILVSEDLPPLGVMSCSKAYMEPAEARATAERCESQALRGALRDHRAWVSVDAMGLPPLGPEKLAPVHALLGRLAAELYDEGCALLLLPASGRVAAPGPKAPAMLRAGQIEELFGSAELHAPMEQVSEDDREVEAAIAEAQRRLPEFLGAFERRASQEPFLFKARFDTDDGRVEVIWLSLVEVTPRGLVGTIENPPIAKNIPRKGQRAERPIDRVVDWAYVDENNQPHGLFVDRILMKRR